MNSSQDSRNSRPWLHVLGVLSGALTRRPKRDRARAAARPARVVAVAHRNDRAQSAELFEEREPRGRQAHPHLLGVVASDRERGRSQLHDQLSDRLRDRPRCGELRAFRCSAVYRSTAAVSRRRRSERPSRTEPESERTSGAASSAESSPSRTPSPNRCGRRSSSRSASPSGPRAFVNERGTTAPAAGLPSSKDQL